MVREYVFSVRWGRSDHYWEGQSDYVVAGNNSTFNKFIGNISPKCRKLFHFPPVGHLYYTEYTLKDLDGKYPGPGYDRRIRVVTWIDFKVCRLKF